jgi:hypothetical protein
MDQSLAKSSSSSAAAGISMGNVKVRFFEGGALVPSTPMTAAAVSPNPNFSVSPISHAEATDKKKAIRSGEGTNTSSKHRLSGSCSCQRGALLGTGT